jgi:hypothetical protein
MKSYLLLVLALLAGAKGFAVSPAWSPSASRGRVGLLAKRGWTTARALRTRSARALGLPLMMAKKKQEVATVSKQSIVENMQQIGATYCLVWTLQDDKFVVATDFTTEARKKAMRQVRGDDKLFATESRRFSLPADGKGPIATAYRTGSQVTIKDTSTMQRAELAKEFGIKKIHFVPVANGVLEYGTPSSEEVVLLDLIGLTIPQLLNPGSPKRFFKLFGELIYCLRLLIAVEENNLIQGIKKTMTGILSFVMEAEERAKDSNNKGSIGSRLNILVLRGFLAITSPFVWVTSYFLDRRNRAKRVREKEGMIDDTSAFEQAVTAFKMADIDGNGVLSFDEFEKAFGDVVNTSVNTAWKEFQDMDIDGDGEISLKEFTARDRPWFKTLQRGQAQ